MANLSRITPYDDRHRIDGTNNLTGAYTITSGGDNSEDLITTIGGGESSYFTSNRMVDRQLEQKEEIIEQLKDKIELLENERDNKWKRQVEELEEENTELTTKNKKWISKYEAEIEKNKAKFNDLHK